MGFPATGWKIQSDIRFKTCKCGSWNQHWLTVSRRTWPAVCSVPGCFNKATQGARVVNPGDPGAYIIPACDSCNARADAFAVKNGTIFVDADKAKTCEKPE
ncbi:MAG: hypothetical protein HY077_00945 [Elusimicrobia bacterium]|nr:hypothetical protein [Elusimicrobiota bacterium]